MQRLLKSGRWNLNAVDSSGSAPLHLATLFRQHALLDVLLSDMSVRLDAVVNDAAAMSALHIAVSNRDDAAVSKLLAAHTARTDCGGAGANSDVCSSQAGAETSPGRPRSGLPALPDAFGRSPVDLARTLGYSSLLKLLDPLASSGPSEPTDSPVGQQTIDSSSLGGWKTVSSDISPDVIRSAHRAAKSGLDPYSLLQQAQMSLSTRRRFLRGFSFLFP